MLGVCGLGFWVLAHDLLSAHSSVWELVFGFGAKGLEFKTRLCGLGVRYTV